ncbi:hypothetical protein HID58_075092 [Brassica napus]|uniref:Uncharacterized protein n=1 Tax=Brassica napus TaxID=3708 RepID=A0ABQ7YIL9_BRANA|nr:hypothetical protein HID58_075092 [Brassica napus]
MKIYTIEISYSLNNPTHPIQICRLPIAVRYSNTAHVRLLRFWEAQERWRAYECRHASYR